MKKILLLFLLLAGGVFLHLPDIQYQTVLFQGDHGRDLYAFWATMNGDLPYRDYWWVYGPLFPFYYGLCFKGMGVTIPSVLLGKMVLSVAAGIFFFLTLALFAPLVFAVLGTLWFWLFQADFFYTYHHAGGILLLLAMIYFLLSYLFQPRAWKAYALLTTVVLLMLTKINFGVSSFCVAAVTWAAMGKLKLVPFQKDRILRFGFVVLTCCLAVAGCYAWLLRGRPLYEIRQCLPYLASDHPFNMTLIQGVQSWLRFLWMEIQSHWPNRLLWILVLISAGRSVWIWRRIPSGSSDKKTLGLAVAVLVLLYLVSLHELFFSGVFYRVYWSVPFGMLLMLVFIGYAGRSYHPVIRSSLPVFLAAVILISFYDQTRLLAREQVPSRYLSHERARAFAGNDPQWFDTVMQTSRYLDKALAPEETFLALPYDPLYYYLSARKSPTRQLIFFEHINIPDQQEQEIIRVLEQQGVDTILLSSRYLSREEGLGMMGEDYCPRLFSYIQKNFQVVAQFGEWQRPSLRAKNHGTLILRRTASP